MSRRHVALSLSLKPEHTSKKYAHFRATVAGMLLKLFKRFVAATVAQKWAYFLSLSLIHFQTRSATNRLSDFVRFPITCRVKKYKRHNFSLLLPKMGCIWKIQLFGHVAWATWVQKFWYWFYIKAWSFLYPLNYIKWKFLRYWAFWGSFFSCGLIHKFWTWF